MLTEVAEWLVYAWKLIWDMLCNGGYIGLAIIFIPILRKLVSIMKQFTN